MTMDLFGFATNAEVKNLQEAFKNLTLSFYHALHAAGGIFIEDRSRQKMAYVWRLI